MTVVRPALFGLHPDAAAVGVDDPLGDAEAEAAAFDGGAVAGVAAEEALEDPRLELGGMPGPVFAITSSAPSSTRRRRDRHRPVRPVVLDRVVGEVQQHLAKTMPVAPDAQRLAGRQADLDARAPVRGAARPRPPRERGRPSARARARAATWPASAFVSRDRPSTILPRRWTSSSWLSSRSRWASVSVSSRHAVSSSPCITVSGVFSSCDAWSVNSRMRWNDWSSRAVMRVEDLGQPVELVAVAGARQLLVRLRSCVRSTALRERLEGSECPARQPPAADQRQQGRRDAAPTG